MELLATPPTVTTTGPVVAPAGTVVLMAVELHLIGEAAVPLNDIVLAPAALPKPEPLMVTVLLTVPEAGETVLIVGVPREKLTVVVFAAETNVPVCVTEEYADPVGGDA
jgi:hypothetical protein